MANIKTFELPSGEAGLTTVFAVLLRRSTGGKLDNVDGVFRANPATMGIPAVETLPGVYAIAESRTVWPDDVYAAFFYDNQGGASDPATSRLLGKDEGPVANDLRLAPYSPALPPSYLGDIIRGLVKDTDSKLADADWNNGLAGALARYSKHRPKVTVADIVGDGTNLYDVPAAWIDEFSSIESIEYPIGDNPETLLDKNDDYAIYTGSGAEQIRLINTSPPATESFRVKFTVLRTEDTIAANDMDAVANLAAHICLGMLAARYIGTGDSTLQADVVNYRSKSQEAASRAKTCLTFYNEHMGVSEAGGVQAASAVSSATLNYPGGGDRLTHPRWGRNRR